MSSPYVYSQTASNDYYQTPYYYHTPRPHTPFFPPSPHSLPASPRIHPVTPPTVPIPFPSAPFPSAPDFNYAPWETRQRRPSWQGPAPSSAWLHPSPDYLPFQAPYPRRHSFSNPSYQPPHPSQYTPWSAPQSITSPQLYINPWINGSSPRNDFYFDLSTTTFTPLRLYGNGQPTILPPEEMREPATHPPLTRLRIICDLIPTWPIHLELPPTPYSPYNSNQFAYQQPSPSSPPITLMDVLVAVHQAMHSRITHIDWAKVSKKEQREITRAYTVRCGGSEHERAQGVKRVDFLLGRTRMIGLVRSRMEDGWEVMRLLLADR